MTYLLLFESAIYGDCEQNSQVGS